MRRPIGKGLGEYFESQIESAPDRTPLRIWGWGVVVPVLIAAYALDCVVCAEAPFLQLRPTRIIHCHGSSAIAVACFYLAIALFLHCHNVWASHEQYHGYGMLGKLVAVWGLITSVIGLTISQASLFRL